MRGSLAWPMLFKPILERRQDVDTDLQITLAGSMHLRTSLHCCLSAGAALALLRQTYQGTADEVVHLRPPHIIPSLVTRLIGAFDREIYCQLTSFLGLRCFIKGQYLLKHSRIS